MQPSRVILLCTALILSTATAFPSGFLTELASQECPSELGPPFARISVARPLDTSADHSYFRPPSDETSGFPKNDKKYHRGPCPCMNSLANHGYIPRDGKSLTPQMLKQVIMDVFNMDDGVSNRLVESLPPSLTLADLSVHNFIEHDTSLVHDDLYFGDDPSHANTTLVDQFLARATKDGFLTKKVVARWRYEREAQSKKTNPQYKFNFELQAKAYVEAVALLVVMGGYSSESISVAHARSFLLEERIPDDFKRSNVPITFAHALFVAAKIKALATFSWALGSK